MSMLLPAQEVLNIFSTDTNVLLFQLHLYLTLLTFAIGTSKEVHSPLYNIGLRHY